VKKEMTEKNKKKVLTSTKINCSRCGKDYYVSFVADGHRNYFCEDCLKIMHHNRKKGVVKKIFDSQKKTTFFEFVCDVCDNFRKAIYDPQKINGQIYCKECLNQKKADDRKKTRKNTVIIKKSEKD